MGILVYSFISQQCIDCNYILCYSRHRSFDDQIFSYVVAISIMIIIFIFQAVKLYKKTFVNKNF